MIISFGFDISLRLAAETAVLFCLNQWFACDPRHNCRRIGRIVIARGRDASDVALTMAFSNHTLEAFSVMTKEVSEDLAFQTSSNAGNGSGQQRNIAVAP
jgi:hypothetical protein